MGLLNVKTILRTQPLGLSISLETAKAHCFIVPEDESQDLFLTEKILAAQGVIEGDATIPFCFFESEYEAIYTLDRERILLPKSGVKRIDSVYVGDGNSWEELPAEQWSFESGDSMDFVIVQFQCGSYPTKKIKIKFVAGYSTADDIPLCVKQAVACLVAEMFDQRGAFSYQSTPYEAPIYKAITANLRRYI